MLQFNNDTVICPDAWRQFRISQSLESRPTWFRFKRQEFSNSTVVVGRLRNKPLNRRIVCSYRPKPIRWRFQRVAASHPWDTTSQSDCGHSHWHHSQRQAKEDRAFKASPRQTEGFIAIRCVQYQCGIFPLIFFLQLLTGGVLPFYFHVSFGCF